MEEGMPNKYQTEQTDTQGFSDQNHPENVKFLLSHQDIFDTVDDYLRGRRWDASKKSYVHTKHPKVNEVGVFEIMAELELRCSKIFSTTYVTKEEIQYFMNSFSEEFVKLLYIKRDKLGLRKEDVPLIHFGVADSVWATLKQSQEDGMKKFLKDSMKIVQTTNLSNGGLLSKGGIFK